MSLIVLHESFRLSVPIVVHCLVGVGPLNQLFHGTLSPLEVVYFEGLFEMLEMYIGGRIPRAGWWVSAEVASMVHVVHAHSRTVTSPVHHHLSVECFQ